MNGNGLKNIIEKIRFVFAKNELQPVVTNSKAYKKIIIDSLSLLLKPLGYKRKGNVFTFAINDLTYYLSLQSSQSSTAQRLKMTINIEMSSLRLDPFRDERLPQSANRIYWERIGTYSDDKTDKWWIINNVDEAKLASEEICNLLKSKVLVQIGLFKSTDDLIAVWKEGKCRGMTDFQRKYYLELLETR